MVFLIFRETYRTQSYRADARPCSPGSASNSAATSRTASCDYCASAILSGSVKKIRERTTKTIEDNRGIYGGAGSTCISSVYAKFTLIFGCFHHIIPAPLHRIYIYRYIYIYVYRGILKWRYPRPPVIIRFAYIYICVYIIWVKAIIFH